MLTNSETGGGEAYTLRYTYKRGRRRHIPQGVPGWVYTGIYLRVYQGGYIRVYLRVYHGGCVPWCIPQGVPRWVCTSGCIPQGVYMPPCVGIPQGV